MKNKVALLLVCVLLLSLFSCSDKSSYTDKVIYGMDTYITLRLSKDGAGEDTLNAAAEYAAGIIAKDEKIMSCHDEEAQIYALNHNVTAILGADKGLISVIGSALNIEKLSSGAFSPSMGALTELWNVEGGGPVPDEAEIEKALKNISSESITVADGNLYKKDENVLIDLGGIAKGYAAQEILEYLATSGISHGVVSIGGNVGVFGEKPNGEPFKVGVCDPDDTTKAVGYFHIKSGFVSVSGDYERFFTENGKRYHHIIDPKTGYPAESGLRSAAVWSQNGSVADALSTALFVMGYEKSMDFYENSGLKFEAVFITNGGEIKTTPGLDSETFETVGEK